MMTVFLLVMACIFMPFAIACGMVHEEKGGNMYANAGLVCGILALACAYAAGAGS
jgi:hypothetical protein